MKNPKGGRPAGYTKEQLLEILLQYTKEHPDPHYKDARKNTENQF